LAVYNKAIRDKIPEIIKVSGYDCNVKKLSDEEFLVKLEEKLHEELEEYEQSKSVEELTDILEVIFRIAELKGTTKDDLEQLRDKKSKDRGGFNDNLFLVDTTKLD
jgi:predicted house-cleaning noncanonical NTP pyrophosphatase (MazG superfamily)